MLVAAPGQTTVPTKAGWHLVSFQNGDVAVLRWNGRAFVWGSLRAPASPVAGVQWLGADVTGMSLRLSTAIKDLPRELAVALISQIDHGRLALGQPVLFTAAGVPKGNSGQTESEAVPVNIIPSPINPNTGNTHLSVPNFLGVLGNLGFWKGIGLVLAGAAILVFAALEFRRL